MKNVWVERTSSAEIKAHISPLTRSYCLNRHIKDAKTVLSHSLIVSVRFVSGHIVRILTNTQTPSQTSAAQSAWLMYCIMCFVEKKCSWITLFSLSQKYNYIQLGCYIKLMHTSTLGHREIFLLLSLWTEQAQLKSRDPRLNRPNVSTTCRTSQLVITAPTATTK